MVEDKSGGSTSENKSYHSPSNTNVNLTNDSSTSYGMSCKNCKQSRLEKCDSCGCTHRKCDKLGIIVEDDFYCKKFDSNLASNSTNQIALPPNWCLYNQPGNYQVTLTNYPPSYGSW